MRPEQGHFNPKQLKQLFRINEADERALFEIVSRHSRDYLDAMDYTQDDLVSMMKLQGKRHIWPSSGEFPQEALLVYRIGDEEFAVIVEHIACRTYSTPDDQEDWKELVMAVSRNPELNTSTGGGTSWINAVDEIWHDRLIAAIRESVENDSPADELFGFTAK